MANEDYDSPDIPLEDSVLEHEGELVPVISRELDSEMITETKLDSTLNEIKEQSLILDKGKDELLESEAILSSLEAYRELLIGAGVVGAKPEAIQYLKVGLESIEANFEEPLISNALNTEDNVTYRDSEDLVAAFESFFKKVGETISKLIDWLIERFHTLYTHYKQGINVLESKLKSIDKDLKTVKYSETTVKLDNLEKLEVNGKVDINNLDVIAGLTEWISETYPNKLISYYDSVNGLVSELEKSEDLDTFNDKLESLSSELKELFVTLNESNGLPGNTSIQYNSDHFDYKVESKELKPRSEELEVSNLTTLRTRHKALEVIVKQLDKAASHNVKVNKSLKDLKSKLDKYAKRTEDNEAIVKVSASLRRNTPGLVAVMSYIVSTLRVYIYALEKEIEVLKNGNDK